uniref:Retrovirus-related Pol polyprotein from transposon TNT 1-94 n=1 Tax=Tanacetum cinerariifolium TaxID=118510 RepID=A0A6L2M2R0_TANCI|nr:retrovirus-related Pol polyprotein from transposon TNT 1-94 [Tanacetum cinerariifolium]
MWHGNRLMYREELSILRGRKSVPGINSRERGNGKKRTTLSSQEKLARKNELKATSTLLMALLKEHQLMFNYYKNTRLQKLISQLEIHEETISQEDLNLSLLRSLPSEWKTHSLIWRNKTDLETLCMDDLYNNLKIYEAEVMRLSCTTQNTQNVAFVSFNNTDSTNKAVNTSHGVSAASSKTNASNLPNVDSVRDARIYSFFANGNVDYESKKIPIENRKESRASKHQDNKNREAPRRTVPIEDTTLNALVTQRDRLGYDWSDQAEDGPTNFALIAYTSSSSSSSSNSNAEVNDKYNTGEGYHAVLRPYTGNYLPPKANLVFADEHVVSESITSLPDIAKSEVKTSATKLKNIWRPTGNVIDHISKDSGSYMLKRFKYVDLQGRLKSEISPSLQIIKRLMVDSLHLEEVLKEVKLLEKMKGIKREFSVARTPQQNEVAKRKNRTLIEAARTMLADSLLPTIFWAEAVNTTCYVQNRVLVTKPYNKTPYELLIGRSPNIDFMKPFGCLVTIFNTLDHLGKFEGKANEGFLVGYSLNSKAFRVFNSRTRKVKENMHIKFLENKSNVARRGLEWLFDIDSLKKSMNYEPVTT